MNPWEAAGQGGGIISEQDLLNYILLNLKDLETPTIYLKPSGQKVSCVPSILVFDCVW